MRLDFLLFLFPFHSVKFVRVKTSMLAGGGSNASRQVKMTSRSPSPGISEIFETETPRALPSLSSKTAERKTFLTAKSDWFCARTRKRPPVSELEKSFFATRDRKSVGRE